MTAIGEKLPRPACDVFLCHNSQDKPIVRRMGELLARNGMKPWIDECELDGGCDWQGALVGAITDAKAVVVCLGPHGLGPWQSHEIKIIVKKRIEAGLSVVPLILSTCGEKDCSVPDWLSIAQIIDLRRDEIDTDPFGRLLSSIDSREAGGHYRPSVVVLRNAAEASSSDACKRLVSECFNLLHRVRVIDYSEMLLEQRLKSTLRHTDVLVSLLAPDSYDERPGSAFQNGIAGRARQLAAEADVKLIQWRSESMLLPSDRRVADRFRTTDTETCLPFELTRDVVATAEARFEPRPPKAADNSAGEDRDNRKRTVLGVPPDDDQFPREIADTLKLNQIRCDSLGKWENLMKRLTQGKSPYDALIVILNGDRAWRDECEVWLDQLETNHSDRLPPIGAYCHRAENRGEAGPVPFDLAQFQEYFGKNDLPKLAKRINAARGGEL